MGVWMPSIGPGIARIEEQHSCPRCKLEARGRHHPLGVVGASWLIDEAAGMVTVGMVVFAEGGYSYSLIKC